MKKVTILSLLIILTASVVSSSHIIIWDVQFETYLMQIQTPFLFKLFNTITNLGNALTVGILTSVAGLFLITFRQLRFYAVGLLVAVLGSAFMDFVMKQLVHRARPLLPIPQSIELTYSFPSGHATVATALYGFIALLCWYKTSHQCARILFSSLFFAIVLLVSFSRLYIGVHFPSDIIAGIMLGALWISIGFDVVKILKKRYDHFQV